MRKKDLFQRSTFTQKEQVLLQIHCEMFTHNIAKVGLLQSKKGKFMEFCSFHMRNKCKFGERCNFILDSLNLICSTVSSLVLQSIFKHKVKFYKDLPCSSKYFCDFFGT